jgi:hypothetical protein
MGGIGDPGYPALGRGVSAFAGALARVAAFARRLSTLAAVAAVLVIGLPLASYYLGRTPATEPEREANDVVLVSPRGETRETQPITFVWRSVAEANLYDVTVQSDDGERVTGETTRDTTLRTSAMLAVGKGYLWGVTAHLTNGGERGAQKVRFQIVGTDDGRR